MRDTENQPEQPAEAAPAGATCPVCGYQLAKFDITCPQCRKTHETLPVTAVTPGTPDRPIAVTVVGIIFLGMAALSLFSSLRGFMGPVSEQFASAGMAKTILYPSYVFGAVSAVLSAVLGVGLLTMRVWARVASIYALVISTVVSTVMQLLLTPVMVNAISASVPADTPAPLPLIIWIGTIVGILFGAAINGVFIYILTRPTVVAAFEARRVQG